MPRPDKARAQARMAAADRLRVGIWQAKALACFLESGDMRLYRNFLEAHGVESRRALRMGANDVLYRTVQICRVRVHRT
jgi:hypothetical protein